MVFVVSWVVSYQFFSLYHVCGVPGSWSNVTSFGVRLDDLFGCLSAVTHTITSKLLSSFCLLHLNRHHHIHLFVVHIMIIVKIDQKRKLIHACLRNVLAAPECLVGTCHNLQLVPSDPEIDPSSPVRTCRDSHACAFQVVPICCYPDS